MAGGRHDVVKGADGEESGDLSSILENILRQGKELPEQHHHYRLVSYAHAYSKNINTQSKPVVGK
jgi:hypothetical protein